MIEKVVSSIVTIIIPTQNRHSYLKRVCKYYDDCGYFFYIVDSSKEACPDLVLPVNGRYKSLPGQDFYSKILTILSEIRTPYVILTADDDLLYMPGLAKAEKIAETNKYCAIFGKTILYKENFDGYFYNTYNFFYKYPRKNIDSENSVERVRMLFKNYQMALWEVVDIATLKEAAEFNVKMNFIDADLAELSVGVFMAKNGAIAFLQDFLNIRELTTKEHWGMQAISPTVSKENVDKIPSLQVDVDKFLNSTYLPVEYAEVALAEYQHSDLVCEKSCLARKLRSMVNLLYGYFKGRRIKIKTVSDFLVNYHS